MQVNSVEAIIDDERLACNFFGGVVRHWSSAPEHP